MQHYKHLIDKYLSQSISEEEKRILGSWVFANEENMNFFKNQVRNFNKQTDVDFDALSSYQDFIRKTGLKDKRRSVFMKPMKYAAIFLMLLGTGLFLKKEFLVEPQKEVQVSSTLEKELNYDEDSIVLKLSDGTSKVLSADGGEVVLDKNGNVIASKADNSMSFDNEVDVSEALIFNEIYIPYGETFKLTLSDGTQVWLNSGSRLKFPQKFVGTHTNRTVYLEGEAFFDVTTNKENPFIVNTNGVDVKVYGTMFNVSSYNEDETVAATLVEGSISLYETNAPEKEVKITPSHQATFNKNSSRIENNKVDTDLYTDWMRDKLVINDLKFSEILAKLERRNNVKIINTVNELNNETFRGEFDDEEIELILKTISMSTPFKYEIEQNIITISKK